MDSNYNRNSMVKQLLKLLDLRPIPGHFSRYPHFLMVGGFSYILNILLTYFFTEYFNSWYLLSFMLAAFVSLSLSFILNSSYTFKGYERKSHSKRYGLYIGFYCVSAVTTFVLVYILTSVFGMYYLFSITIVTLASSLLTFGVNRKFIFLHK